MFRKTRRNIVFRVITATFSASRITQNPTGRSEWLFWKRTLGMKETVLSTKTSGTARKRFEVIVEVINPPPNFFFFFFYAVLFLLSRNFFGFRGAGHICLTYFKRLITVDYHIVCCTKPTIFLFQNKISIHILW